MSVLDRPTSGAHIALLASTLALSVAASPALAQQPPAPTGAPQAGPYRAPTLALVQPTGANPVPRDRPVVVFRFAPGETDDPIDARSFSVRVDGASRTAGFRVAHDEAWGSLADPVASDSMLAPGPHAISARICSVRGLCAAADVTVTVADAMAADTTATPTTTTDKPPTARARLIARVLDAIRRIFVP